MHNPFREAPGDPADEQLVREALAGGSKALPGFRGDSQFRTWLYRIVVNHVLNIRKERWNAIDISRGKAAARAYIDALPEGWGISQVSALELIVGARDNRDLGEIDAFVSAYAILPLRSSTGTRAYQLLNWYAKSHGLHVFDSLVAATAIDEGLTLVTKNRKHFGMIEGLNLAVPQY